MTGSLFARNVLFLGGCIPIRLAATLLARLYPRWFAIAAALISVGFFVTWKFSLRKTGAETFGAKIWWDEWRPVHAILYGLFAVAALADRLRHWAWAFVLFDTALGLSLFLTHRRNSASNGGADF